MKMLSLLMPIQMGMGSRPIVQCAEPRQLHDLAIGERTE